MESSSELREKCEICDCMIALHTATYYCYCYYYCYCCCCCYYCYCCNYYYCYY